MARANRHERETLRISADAAAKLVTKLRDDRTHLDDRIARLQAVVDAWNALSRKRAAVDTAQGDRDTAAPSKKRVPKGQVPKHIEQVLQDGGEYEEPELRKAIEERFAVTYGRATVYTSLRRGLKDHKFIQNGTKWSLNPLRTTQHKS